MQCRFWHSLFFQHQAVVFKDSCPPAGIDGPAAFLVSESNDLGTKIQVQSVSPPHKTSPPPSEEPERDGDTETLLEPKTDIHTLLQRRGEYTSTQLEPKQTHHDCFGVWAMYCLQFQCLVKSVLRKSVNSALCHLPNSPLRTPNPKLAHTICKSNSKLDLLFFSGGL